MNSQHQMNSQYQLDSSDEQFPKQFPKLLYDRYFLILLMIIFVFTAFTVYKQSSINYVGLADDAQYAQESKNILEGKGIVVDFVQYYFVKYSSITRPDDVASPLYPILGALSFAIFGISALSAKLVSIFFGLAAIPLLIYFFGKKLFGILPAFFGAMLSIFNPFTYTAIIHNYTDSLFAFLFLLSIFFLYKSFDDKRWLYVLGTSIGFMILAKNTGFLIAPVIILAYLLEKRSFPKQLIYAGMLSAIIVFPLLLRNYLLFGSPFSTVLSYIVYVNGTEGPGLYWGAVLPSFSWMLGKYGLWWWIAKDLTQIKITFFALFPIILALVLSFSSSLRKRLVPIYLLFILFFIIHTVYWIFDARYYISFFALGGIIGFGWIFHIAQKLKSNGVNNAVFIIKIFSLIIILLIAFYTSEKYYATFDLKNFNIGPPVYPFVATNEISERLFIFDWIDKNLPPSSVLMSTRVRDLSFYSHRKAVQIPIIHLNQPEQLIKIIQYYNVTHIVENMPLDQKRDIYQFVRNDSRFKIIYSRNNTLIYEILPS